MVTYKSVFHIYVSCNMFMEKTPYELQYTQIFELNNHLYFIVLLNRSELEKGQLISLLSLENFLMTPA